MDMKGEGNIGLGLGLVSGQSRVRSEERRVGKEC